LMKGSARPPAVVRAASVQARVTSSDCIGVEISREAMEPSIEIGAHDFRETGRGGERTHCMDPFAWSLRTARLGEMARLIAIDDDACSLYEDAGRGADAPPDQLFAIAEHGRWRDALDARPRGRGRNTDGRADRLRVALPAPEQRVVMARRRARCVSA
jgi:hypothetical protein